LTQTRLVEGIQLKKLLRKKLLYFAFITSLWSSLQSAGWTAEQRTDDAAWRKSVEQIIEDYIRSRPELIEQALQSLEKKREAEEQERVKAAIVATQDELLRDPASPVSGNPAGDVTVIEFFDYRCGHCKRVSGTVSQLQKDDSRVRVMYKDFPILGDESVFAAKAALAARAQGKHNAFHDALYAAKAELNSVQVLKIAAQVGLNTKKLATDMKNPELDATIERNRALANELGINGTPAFIVGKGLLPGAVDLDTIKQVIARARQGVAKTVGKEE
jgi:protein-disulfide isomerase